VARVLHRKIDLCVGSDSNVRIDPLEELRELEGIARRQTGMRGVIPVDDLLAFGAGEGAAALGLADWPAAVVDVEHPQLRGVDAADVYEALLFSCTGDVLRKTSDQWRVRER
jgi:formimidoylglutamate deiminase